MKFLLLDPEGPAAHQLNIPEPELPGLSVYTAFGFKFFEAVIKINFPHCVIIFGNNNGFDRCRDYVQYIVNEKAFGEVKMIYLGKYLNEEKRIWLYEHDVEVIDPGKFSTDNIMRLLKVLVIKWEAPRRLNEDFLQVMPDRLSVMLSNREVPLLKKEFILFQLFYAYPNCLLSRKEILDFAWNGLKNKSDRTMDVHICSLRKKLGVQIVSIRNQGFRLDTFG